MKKYIFDVRTCIRHASIHSKINRKKKHLHKTTEIRKIQMKSNETDFEYFEIFSIDHQ